MNALVQVGGIRVASRTSAFRALARAPVTVDRRPTPSTPTAVTSRAGTFAGSRTSAAPSARSKRPSASNPAHAPSWTYTGLPGFDPLRFQ